MKSKFVVYDNGVKAQYPESDVDESWDCCSFDTLEQAVEYARRYFYPSFRYPRSVEKVTYNFSADEAEIRIEEDNEND